MKKGFFIFGIMALMFFGIAESQAAPSKCEECHIKISPLMVKDFNRSKMAGELTCASCHGGAHESENDVEKYSFRPSEPARSAMRNSLHSIFPANMRWD